MRTRKS